MLHNKGDRKLKDLCFESKESERFMCVCVSRYQVWKKWFQFMTLHFNCQVHSCVWNCVWRSVLFENKEETWVYESMWLLCFVFSQNSSAVVAEKYLIQESFFYHFLSTELSFNLSCSVKNESLIICQNLLTLTRTDWDWDWNRKQTNHQKEEKQIVLQFSLETKITRMFLLQHKREAIVFWKEKRNKKGIQLIGLRSSGEEIVSGNISRHYLVCFQTKHRKERLQ